MLREHPATPVLLLRRAFGEYDGRWCFVAGTVESGESPRQAAERELAEETGLEAGEIGELLVRSEGDLRLHVFVARVSDPEAIRLDSEHTASRWLSFDEARALLPLEAQRVALDAARGGCIRVESAADATRAGRAARPEGDPNPD